MQSFAVDNSLRASVDFSPIDDLLSAGMGGFRTFEAFRVQDLVNYVDVAVESDRPELYAWWPEGCHAAVGVSRLSAPVLDAWFLPGVPGEAIAAASREAAARWSQLEALRAHLRQAPDEMIRYEVGLLEAGEHPNDLLLAASDPSVRVQRHFRGRFPQRYTQAEYDLLADVLAHPGVRGFALRGVADAFVLRLACREQFRRCGNELPHSAAQIFPVAVLGLRGGPTYDPDDGCLIALDPMPAWSRRVRWQFEGLRPHGLFFDQGGYGGVELAAMEGSGLDPMIDAVVALRPLVSSMPNRAWFAHAGGMALGLSHASVGHWKALLERHKLSSQRGVRN
jgi:hypothetical protein